MGLPSSRSRGANAHRPRPLGCSAWRLAMWATAFMESTDSKSVWCNEGRASYAFVKTNARPFVGK